MSPPSSLLPNWKHHVFPSFHGADVRKAFLSHILKEFRIKGINPFIDNAIERSKSIGPELIEAIRGSRIAIIFLSKNYASSTWCLDELVEIIKCREELGQTVLVLFYEVDPTDVKKQTGDFGKVFRKTCKGKTKDKIGKWRHALAEVAQIAGYHSSNWDNEAEMIEKIATDVSSKLNNSTSSSDFDGLVGMESHMMNLGALLRLDLEEVRIIGILGPSGIGKTTIARFLFNQHSGDFQLSVFMDNINRRYAIIPSCSDDYSVKLYLQEQFLSLLTNEVGIKIPHLGIAKDRLKDKKVLVVLDGVDRLIQLEAMAKESCWFGPRSRIIITTQDEKVLKGSGINHIYRVDFPSSDEALQMFCMYAFGQKSPKDGFEELAWEVTRHIGKLPLGLRVMGSYFRGMSEQEWRTALPRLMTRLDGEIESILKFSYDALCDEDKNLFLHIACFFNDEKINIVEGCLENCFMDVTQGLRVLAEKSLISLSKFGHIEMHNLLGELGKEIVRKQSVSEPWKRQFLNDAKYVGEVIGDDKAGHSSVIGIRLIAPHRAKEDILCTSNKTSERWSSLQFLKIDGDGTCGYFPRSLNSLSPKLRLLTWDNYRMPCFPSSFQPKFLVKLDMQCSSLEKLWEETQPLNSLKWIDLTFSSELKELPDLSTATNLQELNLRGCSSLVELPSSIGNAINLQKLNLSDCLRLVELPSSIGNAINLQKLNLSGCSSLVELPSSIGNAINIRKLILDNCSSLMELPSSIGNLINMKQLDINCEGLVELPSSLGNLISLKELRLACNSSLVELPSSITNITSPKTFSLDGCSSLKKLPFDIGTFTDQKDMALAIDGWSSLVEIPSSIGNATNIVSLSLCSCTSLRKLPDSIGNLINLQSLGLSFCTSMVEIPSCVGHIKNLQKLELIVCSSLMKLPYTIGDAINLQKLDLYGCSSLVELPYTIGNAVNLQEMRVTNCTRLMEIPSSIGNLINLRELNLNHCSSLVELPSTIGNAVNLQELRVAYCTRLMEIPSSIGNLINLQKLKASNCTRLMEIPSSIGNLINLKKLDLSYCSGLMEIPSSIGNLINLQKLNLNHCSSLVELPFSMRNLCRLRNLELEKCEKLVVNLANINLESHEELDLSDCSMLKVCPETSTGIADSMPSGTVPSSTRSRPLLSESEMSYSEIQELDPWIGRVSCLRRLVLSGMQKLVSLPQLPYSLTYLDADNCESLETLDCSFRNPAIRLNFAECFKLNQEARDLIITTPTNEYAILSGEEVPECFTYRASGSSLTVKLNQKPFGTSTKFRACILLADANNKDYEFWTRHYVSWSITSKQNAFHACRSGTEKHGRKAFDFGEKVFPGHLYTFEVEATEVTSPELVIEFKLHSRYKIEPWEIKECGMLQLV